MSLFWTQRAVAGVFAEEAKAFVTSSPGTANSIDFPACSCTDLSARSRRQCHEGCGAGTNPATNGCSLSPAPAPQKPATHGAARVTAVSARR